MNNPVKNTLVLVGFIIVILVTGLYLTRVAQSKEIERLVSAEKLLRLKEAEVSTLLAEEASSARMAEESVRKWRARYKVIPDTLTSPRLIHHLNQLTRTGFRNFDISLDGVHRAADYNIYSFKITGRAFYTALYDFIWNIENERQLFKVRDLVMNRTEVFQKNPQTGVDRQQIMVSFTLVLDAYFGGIEGASAPDAFVDIPAGLFPVTKPASNPFYPLVMQDLPPNSEGYVDVERATLVSVVGGEAVFQDGEGFRTLQVGSPVYLGHITRVDPAEGRVVARLNKGGIVDEVETNLHDGERYRRALGTVRLIPIDQSE